MSDRVPATAAVLIAGAVLLACLAANLDRTQRYDDALATRPITYRIDPNAADTETLCLLPGIGPGIAQRIIDHREAHGPFTSATDMTRVKMVGTKTAAAIEPWTRFGPPRPE